eukprot:TRINITY_DN5492_c0_g2_i1.p1 TRINITY_DN5492_c0_g2~~TRINITY_DN5492_c0_g2_i1.p1  ORF type:complete len:103 (+),score=2.33 TRINITY_DN5492_c0_g2_i1:230-538(+)
MAPPIASSGRLFVTPPPLVLQKTKKKSTLFPTPMQLCCQVVSPFWYFIVLVSSTMWLVCLEEEGTGRGVFTWCWDLYGVAQQTMEVCVFFTSGGSVYFSTTK